MNILGLDLSLTSTGLSSGDKTWSIAPGKLRGAERLSFVSRQILDFITKENIQCVIIEGYSFGSRNSQSHSIGELGGCVRMLLWESGCPFVEVPPTSRAKFATGKGNAGKTEVISAVSAKTGLQFFGNSADDQCDAWILQEMGLAHIGMARFDWNKDQLVALEKVDWASLDRARERENSE